MDSSLLLGLGLKEAKEMVESSPQWIKKELPKEEAEELCAKPKPQKCNILNDV